MATIDKFLEIHGDKILNDKRILEPDMLVFTLLSYANFEALDVTKKRNLYEKTCKLSIFFKNEYIEKLSSHYILPKSYAKFLTQLFKTKRYQDIEIGWFESESDFNSAVQFFAMVFKTENYNFVIFRGTDISITGWKEDFHMAFNNPVLGQVKSIDYVKKVSLLDDKTLIVLGHSKGGNLAYYSFLNSDDEIKKRIKRVYNFDGPAFKNDTYDYDKYKKKLMKFVPNDDVVGVLFEKSNNFEVIYSKKWNVFAHDMITWEFDKETNYKSFKRNKSGLSRSSKVLKISFDLWIKEVSYESAEDVTDFVFGIALLNKQDNLLSLKNDVLKEMKFYFSKIIKYEPEKRKSVIKVCKEFVFIYFKVLINYKNYAEKFYKNKKIERKKV